MFENPGPLFAGGPTGTPAELSSCTAGHAQMPGNQTKTSSLPGLGFQSWETWVSVMSHESLIVFSYVANILMC